MFICVKTAKFYESLIRLQIPRLPVSNPEVAVVAACHTSSPFAKDLALISPAWLTILILILIIMQHYILTAIRTSLIIEVILID